jgi:acyl-CoA synthetase (AMP-forming)/AMP-acid ligase II/pimeloyl-ACP methyl ester carboxylesterase
VDTGGVPRTWHVLDNAASLGGAAPAGTLLCVHGNPTWSYMWRRLLAAASAADPPWRVVAVDHLDMGLSERTGTVRRAAQRVADLGTVTAALGLRGRVVTVGHDWGGVISLGWALDHRDRLAGVVLTNTAVHRPRGGGVPPLMRLARVPGLRAAVTVATPGFVRAALALARPALCRQVRSAYLAPYRGVSRRAAIGRFVADIPLSPGHPSWPAVARIAEGLGALADVPALLLWGARDPVFTDDCLRDLRGRLPHAAVHRFEGAGHLLAEDADLAGAVLTWLAHGLDRAPAGRAPLTRAATGQALLTGSTGRAPRTRAATGRPPARPAPPARPRRPLWAGLTERATDPGPAIIQLRGRGRPPRVVSWALLARRVTDVAAGLAASGARAGDRVALLGPPGPDLAVAGYACLRIGAVIVVADAGLGAEGLHRAIRGAAPRYLVGASRDLVAARARRWPGTPIAAGGWLPGASLTLAGLARRGAGRPLPPPPGPDRDAAVVFTSGATGPAKGVIYNHGQIEAGRDALGSAYPLGADDRLVAAFAAFALLGPGLGVPTVVPDCDVTAPAALTAAALADGVAAGGATAVVASPAALANLVRTAAALGPGQRGALRRVRLLLSAGAPVPVPLLNSVTELMPAAAVHTPYGMTEVLPVTDVTLSELVDAGPGEGVLAGRPLRGVTVAISPLDASGAATGDLTTRPGVTGEIVVRAAHVMDRYDQLWVTGHGAAQPPGWHRTGDVGHLDGQGRLWVEGQLAHVLTTAHGVLTPVGAEQRIQRVTGVERAALVGIGPAGAQQAVAVLEAGQARQGQLAPPDLATTVRVTAGMELAAVLLVAALPCGARHNATIDRASVARWADRVLMGSRGGAP